MRLTQPCRDTLELLGSPSDELLIAHRHKNLSEGGPFRTDWLSGGIGDHTMASLGAAIRRRLASARFSAAPATV